MKKVILLSAIASAFVLGSCGNSSTESKQTSSLDTTKLAKGDTFYQCEMHPEALSDKTGTCPKCGMDLMKAEKK